MNICVIVLYYVERLFLLTSIVHFRVLYNTIEYYVINMVLYKAINIYIITLYVIPMHTCRFLAYTELHNMVMPVGLCT